MKTILLVEDQRDLADVITRELSAAGYNVLQSGDGESALECVRSAHPDLIILDWMLPKLSGLDVLRRLRRSEATPVLMLTARSEETDRVVGLELGADDYVTKPFSMRELVARVGALLRRLDHIAAIVARDHNPAVAALAYGSLRLDPEAHSVTLDGASLELSRTEFALLQLLLANPGRTFGRGYLLDAVWGETYVTGDRSVDNAILRLRKKLGEMGEAIDTVWGVGYRLRRKS